MGLVMISNIFEDNLFSRSAEFSYEGRFIYYLVNDGVVVYVGQTSNLPSRAVGHQSSSKSFDKVTFLKIAEGVDLNDAEFIQILTHKPKYNCSLPESSMFVGKTTISSLQLKESRISGTECCCGYDLENPDVIVTINGKSRELWVDRTIRNYECRKHQIINFVNKLIDELPNLESDK